MPGYFSKKKLWTTACAVLTVVALSSLRWHLYGTHGPSRHGGISQRTVYARTRETSDRILLPPGNTSHFLEYLSLEDAQVLFHRYVTRRDVHCTNLVRAGDVMEGGYEICMMGTYRLVPGACLVYSFGVGENWSFDDEVRQEYGCEVHSFDPSLNITSHTRGPGHFFHDYGIWSEPKTTDEGWNLKDLGTIKTNLGHKQKIIDVLKIDVEGAEWPALRSLVNSGVTSSVKQIIMEIHSPRFRQSRGKVDRRDFGEMFDILLDLQRAGYRKYLHHSDKYCCSGFSDLVPFSVANKLLCCYELFLVNINFQTKIDILI